MTKKYIVRLSEEERQVLNDLVDKGKVAAYRIKHANILLKTDVEGPAWTDEQTAEAFNCHAKTVRNVRQRLVELGFEAALNRNKQTSPSRQRKLDGAGEAKLIAIGCRPAPEGRARWTLQMLADELITLEVVESISDQTVRRTLKKTNSALIAKSVG